MRFKDWFLGEELHKRLNGEHTVSLPGPTPRSTVRVTFDTIDFRWERYLDKRQTYGKWTMEPSPSNHRPEAESLRDCRGVQGKFPLDNSYIHYRKQYPTMVDVGPYQPDLEVMPDRWWWWALFTLNGEPVYWKAGPRALDKRVAGAVPSLV